MKCQDAAPEDVLDALAKAADITLEAGNTAAWSSTGAITLDVKDRPFWPVFIDACRQARVDFQTYVNDRSSRRVQLTPGSESRLASMPMFEAEGCLLVLQSANRTHNLQYGSGRGNVRIVSGRGGRGGTLIQTDSPNQSTVNFSLQALVLVDPKFRLAGTLRATLTNAVDENGTSFLLPGSDRSGQMQVYYDNTPRGFFQQTSFNLYYPTNAGRKLAKMEGTIRFPAVLKEETWEISDVLNAKPETKDLGGRIITFQSVRKPQNGSSSSYYEVRVVEGASPESDAPGLRRTPSTPYQITQSMTLLATDGTQFSQQGTSSPGNEIRITFYSPNRDVVPSKLVWKVPTDIREFVAPFTVTDLPIP